MATLTTEQRIAAWFQAYTAISSELTPQVMRETLALLKGAQDQGTFQSAMALAASVMRNDRAAAVAAAMITSSGIRPVPLEGDE